jgi:hypothetical protein
MEVTRLAGHGFSRGAMVVWKCLDWPGGNNNDKHWDFNKKIKWLVVWFGTCFFPYGNNPSH